MDWFLNYHRAPYRETSFNLAVARVLVCVLVALKVAAYPFAGIAAFPLPLVASGVPGLWWIHPHYAQWIGWEQGAAVVCLVACALGIAPGLTALLSAALVSHLSAIAWPVCLEKTWLPTIYFLLIYAVFRHEDRHVLWPRPGGLPLSPGRDPGPPDVPRAPLHSLAWFLLTIAAIYFFAGVHKLEHGGWRVEWASPTNMARMLEHRSLGRGDPLPPVAAWVLKRPILLGAMGASTVILELGLLVAVFTDRFLTPCFLGLAAMHLGILATMRVNYLTDFGAVYLVFVPWDSIVDAVRRRRRGP